VRGIIGEIVNSAEEITLLDMEASIEHLNRGTIRHVDALLVVAEPYYRALETAGRTVPLARGLGIERIYAIANKLRGADDEKAVMDYCRNHDLEIIAAIPFDESVSVADRMGRAVIDYAPDALLVAEIGKVADALRARLGVKGFSIKSKEPLAGEARGHC
jgi:CO dehydrogenase maturation factor